MQNEYCPNCGHKLNTGVEFCPNCGYQLLANQQVTRNYSKHNDSHSSRKLIWIIAGLFIVLLACGACYLFLNNGHDSKTGTSMHVDKQKSNQSQVTKKAKTDSSKTGPISESEAMSLLKKAGYEELSNPEKVNSSDEMTTINTFEDDDDSWIKNTYTLYPNDNKVEIHLQSYKGTDVHDPASFQDQISATGPKKITVKR